MIQKAALAIIGAIMIAAFIAVLFGWFVMSLWNGLVPVIFGLPQIGFWQAVGLCILCDILFKSHTSSSK